LAVIPAAIERGRHPHGRARAHHHEHVRVW
jgi:hypothetical protein